MFYRSCSTSAELSGSFGCCGTAARSDAEGTAGWLHTVVGWRGPDKAISAAGRFRLPQSTAYRY